MNIHVPNTGSFRSATEMEILERPLEWLRDFQEGWLSHLEKTGKSDWSLYTYPQNFLTPSTKGIALAKSRLLLISTAGSYFRGQQQPFKCERPLGDYSIRLIPISVDIEKLAFLHPGLDRKYLQADPQVLLPLDHLRSMVASNFLGSLAPVFVSFCGFQPHVIRVVKELIPNILKVAKEHQVRGALIIPAGTLCVQTAGLVARALEVNNIATTMTTWDPDMAHLTAPPRLTATFLPSGAPLGMPSQPDQQIRILQATLKLLEMDSPTGIVYLNEIASM